MKRLSWRMAALVVLCTVVAVPSFAGGFEFLLLEEGALDSGLITHASCTFRPYPGGSLLVYLPNQDSIENVYYFVSPDACPDCTAGVVQISSIEYASRTVSGGPCTYTVEVSVVGATSDACPAPDESVVLCPATAVEVTVTQTLSPIMVPLPAGCCISQDAFIRIRFLGAACNDGFPHPLMYTGSGACASCTEYFTSIIAHPSVTEVCTVFSNNFWYRVNADCCEPVKTEQQTWGGVKSLYR